jgi:DNA-binding CsgD family transcriptional regulator
LVNTVDALAHGRESFEGKAWGDAHAQLSAADLEAPLELDDLERLAAAAYLSGRDAESEEIWGRAHHESLDRSDWARAARCAFWLGISLSSRSENAKASGWLARGQRVVEESGHQCAEQGWLLIPVGLQLYHTGDHAGSSATFEEAAKIGSAYADHELVVMARQAQGRALIRLGQTQSGLSMLDEAMVAVTAGEVSPIPAGIIYCSVIEACQEILDIRRAHDWTAALSDWCASQPDLVLYRGRCLVHRAEIMQLHGDWPEAIEEARQACKRLSVPPQPQLGMAYHRLAELHRLRGSFEEAEEAYREAAERRQRVEPGPSLLRLAEGRVDAAVASMRRALDEARTHVPRSKVLPACVEIMLAADEVGAARACADELSRIAGDVGAPLLFGLAAHAQAAVLLAEGDPRAALEEIDRAWAAWDELEVPYEAARLRVLVGLAYRGLGDQEGAASEFASARRVFEQLGARPDMARLEEISRSQPRLPAGLTAREGEVLALVAKGKSNREIATELVISERTVARHMSNIFTKLDVSSRTAASAFAFQHNLV